MEFPIFLEFLNLDCTTRIVSWFFLDNNAYDYHIMTFIDVLKLDLEVLSNYVSNHCLLAPW